MTDWSLTSILPASSTDPNDPDHRADNLEIGPTLILWLDGVEQRDV
ncbi:hypothetical protein HNO88_004291 [Novosphingobium chloroacetimidivorans]|uniref:Uncharacterized protein n=1 Tax=Novosphingobium chloroacetimidivorans TaxID=1428314 RepID=A0A7W7NZ62_9SPHN|nr:hypothetical protein [Novosphingobium chloroacetimidivorans]MBB4860945.1 hypothetical protein [Novosphingobium chloroacetimidivorans]